jgi:hypothetical protein
LAIGMIVRAIMLISQAPQLDADPDNYRELAIHWDRALGMVHLDAMAVPQPTAFRPPAYPWLLSWSVVEGQLPSLAVGAWHLAAIAISLLGTVWLAVRLNVDPRAALVFMIFDPVLISQQSQVMTETFSAAAMVMIWCGWCKLLQAIDNGTVSGVIGWALGLGGWSVGAHLLRPTFAPMVVLLIVGVTSIAWWRSRSEIASGRARASRAWLASLVLTLVFVSGVGAWTIRNQRRLGAPIWATTHGGYTLLLANNPYLFDWLRQPGPRVEAWEQKFHARWAKRSFGDPRQPGFWRSTLPQSTTAQSEEAFDEVVDDRLASQSAIAAIRREPGAAVRAGLYRWAWLWGLWPQNPHWAKWFVGAWYAAVYGLIVRALMQRGARETFSRRWWAGWAMVLALTAVHSLYWSNLRMRAPATPLLALMAAAGVARPRRPVAFDEESPDRPRSPAAGSIVSRDRSTELAAIL